MSIEVNHVSKSYGNQLAVADLSFTLTAGEIVGLLGPNGAGKSTTINMLCGLIPPDQGDIRLFGKALVPGDLSYKRRIGYLSESNPLYRDMYVREFLGFMAALQGLNKKQGEARTEEVIALLGLGKEAHKKIQALSKGYQQRVGIAQALIHDPEVLILDEPSSGLDPNQMLEIRELILQLAPQKLILFSSHLLSEVAAIAHRILLIHQGQLVADEATAVLQAREGGLESFFKEKTRPHPNAQEKKP